MLQYILLCALAFDFMVGEVPNCMHPVVGIGRIIERLRDWGLRCSKTGQFLWGVAVAGLLPTGCAALLVILARTCDSSENWGLKCLSIFISIYMLKGSFSIHALGRAGQSMAEALRSNDLVLARHRLRSLCSRQSEELRADELAGATIESLSENLCDSIVAPLFYFAIFGVPGAFFFRVVNTLDAMIGYHGRFEYLGKASARLDDLLNWIPARLSVLLILVAGLIVQKDVQNGIRIALRDRKKTDSPNAGWSMATMAGLLKVELNKRDHYRLGATLGSKRSLDANAIDDCWEVIRIAGWITALLSFIALQFDELPIIFFASTF